jgi:hypothetical protein
MAAISATLEPSRSSEILFIYHDAQPLHIEPSLIVRGLPLEDPTFERLKCRHLYGRICSDFPG